MQDTCKLYFSHCSVRTVNSIPCSIPKCWLVLKGLSELRSSLITCFLTHRQHFPPCSHPDQQLISTDGQLPALYLCSMQLPQAVVLSLFYRDLLPTAFPLLQRAPQHSNVQAEEERHKQKDGLPDVTQMSPVSWAMLQPLAQASSLLKHTLYLPELVIIYIFI